MQLGALGEFGEGELDGARDFLEVPNFCYCCYCCYLLCLPSF